VAEEAPEAVGVFMVGEEDSIHAVATEVAIGVADGAATVPTKGSSTRFVDIAIRALLRGPVSKVVLAPVRLGHVIQKNLIRWVWREWAWCAVESSWGCRHVSPCH
jgi:hypothetical protein